MILLILIAAAALALGWLVATWYFADNEPVFGPGTEKRVTFKDVLARAIIDTRELFDRLTNMVAVMVVSLDGIIASTPELKAALLASPWGFVALLALNLFAALSPRKLA